MVRLAFVDTPQINGRSSGAMSPYLERPLRTLAQVLAERQEQAAKGPLSPPFNEWFERERKTELLRQIGEQQP